MAKRKKLNKRVVVLLVAFSVIFAGIVTVVILVMLPKNHAALAEQAREAHERKNLKMAGDRYRQAIAAARNDPAARATYQYELGMLQWEWAKVAPGLTRTEQETLISDATESLRKALLEEPNMEKAQRLMCDMLWERSHANLDLIAPQAIGPGNSRFIAEATKLLALKKDDHQTYFRRALAHAGVAVSAGGEAVRLAAEDFDRAISLKPDEVRYHLRKADFHEARDLRDEADTVYQSAIATNPDDPELRVCYAHFLLRHREPKTEQAEQQLAEAVSRAPNDPVGKLALAQLRRSQTRFDEAISLLMEARDIDPSDHRPYAMAAEVYQFMRKPQEAVTVLREGLGRFAAQASTGPATQSARESRRISDTWLHLNVLLANVLLDMASEQSADRPAHLAQASQCLEQISKKTDAADPDRLKIQGRIAVLQGNGAEALKLLEQANETFRGRDPVTLGLLIDLYRQQRQPTKAEELINSLLAAPANQNNPALLRAKAELEIGYRMYSQAIGHLRQVVSADPNFRDAGPLLGALEFVVGPSGPLPADVDLDVPSVLRAILAHATDLWGQNRRTEAVVLLRDVHNRMPDNYGVAMQLAQWYASVDQPDQAQVVLDRLLASRKDDARVAEQVEAVKSLMAAKSPDERFAVRMALVDKTENELDRNLQKFATCQAFGKEQQAMEYLLKAQQMDPNAPGVVSMSFELAVGKSDWAEAKKWAQAAKRLNSDRLGGRSFEARLALAQKQYDSAITILNGLLAERPDKEMRVMLGDVYRANNQPDKAYSEYEQALRIDRSFEPALVRLAELSEAMNRIPEHRRYVLAALSAGSHHPYVVERWLTMREADDPEGVLKERQLVFDRNPDNLVNCLALAGIYKRVDQLAEAEKMYRHVHDRSPNKLAGAVELAKFYLETRRPNDVDKVMQDMLKELPDKAHVYVAYGQLLASYNRGQAAEMFQKAVEVDPSNAVAHASQARFLAEIGQFAQAADTMDKALALRPDAMGKISEMEMIQWRISAGQFDDASARIERILKADPAEPNALRLKILLLMAKNDLKGAEDLATFAVRKHPALAQPLALRSQVYRLQGELEKTRADLEAAAKIGQTQEIGTELGNVHLALYDTDKARQAFTEVINRWPDHEPATRGLINIYLREQNWRLLEPLLAAARKRHPRSWQYLLDEAAMWRVRDDQTRRLSALGRAYALDQTALPVVHEYLKALLDNKRLDDLSALAEELRKDSTTRPIANAVLAAALAEQNKPQADELFMATLRESPPGYVGMILEMAYRGYGAQTRQKLPVLAAARPDSFEMNRELSVLWQRLGDVKAAEKPLTEAIRLAQTPEQKAHAQIELGTLHLVMHEAGMADGYLASSEKLLLEAEKVLPRDFRMLNNLAYLYASYRDDPEKALPYARGAAKLNPDGKVLDTYGWTLARLSQYDEAEKVLLRAVALEPKLAQVRHHLGWLYEKTHQYSKAYNEYRLGREMTAEGEPLRTLFDEGLQRLPR